MKKNILFFLFLLIVIGSCKKEYPLTPVAPAAPEFTFSGTVNGVPVNLQAGVNNYYMFTSYAKDSLSGAYDFQGQFRDKNSSASNCPNSLKISIRDYRSSSSLPSTNIDSLIIPGYYSFATLSGASSKYYVQFSDDFYNGTAKSYSWDFGDGGKSSYHNTTHMYNHPGIYHVSLNVQSTGACSSSLDNDIVVGQVGNPIQVGLVGGPVIGNTVTLATSVGGGTGSYTYNWNFGDGNTALSTAGAYTYTYSSSGVYPVTLSVTDGANTTEVAHVNIPTKTVTYCYMNFYAPNTTPMQNQNNLSDVMLEWCDANGKWWTSTDNNQSTKSMFKIISVDNYQNNISGQPTKKIHAKISCTLYNSSTPMDFEGDVVFSIAHL